MVKRYIVYVGLDDMPEKSGAKYMKKFRKHTKNFFKKKDKILYIPVHGDNAKTYIERLV